MIDTGAPSTTMRLSTARGDLHGMDGIKINAFPHTFHSMTFGGITLNDTQMIVADIDQGKGREQTGSRIRGNHDQPDVIIGMSLLRKLHLFIAYSEPARLRRTDCLRRFCRLGAAYASCCVKSSGTPALASDMA
jgi:hypothetical protein